MASEKETNSVILLLQHLIEKTDIKEQFFIVVTPNIATLALILLVFLTLSHVYILIHIHTYLWTRRNGSATEATRATDSGDEPPVRGGRELVRSNRRETDSHSDGGTEQYSPVPVTENDTTPPTSAAEPANQPYYSPAASAPNWPSASLSQAQTRLATANIGLINSIRRRAANPIADDFLTSGPRSPGPGPGRSRGSLVALFDRTANEGTRPGFGSNRTTVWSSASGSNYEVPVAGGGAQRNGGERGGAATGVSRETREGETEIPASQ